MTKALSPKEFLDKLKNETLKDSLIKALDGSEFTVISELDDNYERVAKKYGLDHITQDYINTRYITFSKAHYFQLKNHPGVFISITAYRVYY